MNKTIKNALLLLLCLTMALSCFAGCKGKKNTIVSSSSQESANSDSGNDTSSEENVEDESSDGSEPIDDDWDDMQPVEDSEDEEDDMLIGQATVKNAQAPVNTTYRGFGSVIYQMYTYMPYTNKKNEFTEKQAQEQFNRMQKIGIDYIRSDYNSWMAYDSDKGGFDYESTYMKAFYKEALELKKRNISACVTTGWSLHALTDDSSSIASRELYVANDWSKTLSNWKNWMHDSLLAFRSHGCTNITGMLLFTEPGKVGWEKSYRYANFDAWIDCARTLDGLLKDMGLRNQYQLIGPNQSNPYNSDMLEYMLQHADPYVDVYTSHDYVKSTEPTADVYYDYCKNLYDDYYMATMKKYNSKKPFWLDEWNVGQSGQQLAVNSPWIGTQLGVCATAIMGFGIQNSIIWSLYNQQWPRSIHSGGEFVNGIQMCGYADSLQLSTIPTTQYYAFTLLSRYLKGMNIVYRVEFDTMLGIYYAFAQSSSGETVIIVVNAYLDKQGFELELDKSIGGATLYRHLYNPTTCKPNTKTQILPADRTYKPVTDKLVDILPAGGLAVYTTVKGE